MSKKYLITIVFTLLSIISYPQQKKSLSHNDYDLWKRISNVNISERGNVIVSEVEVTTKRGDGYIEIYNVNKGTKSRFINGYESKIKKDEAFIFFKQKPLYETIRSEKKKGLKDEKLSKDSWYIFDVRRDKIYDSIQNVKSYAITEKAPYKIVVESIFKKDETKDSVDKKKTKASNILLVYDLKTKKKDTIYDVKEYKLAEKANQFYYTIKKGKKKSRDNGVFKYDLITGGRTLIDSTQYLYSNLSTDKLGKQLAFHAVKDSVAEDSLKYALHYFNGRDLKKIKIKQSQKEISQYKTALFADKGDRLFFYIKDISRHKKDTTLLDEEIPEVDVWNWKDKLIQPEQKSKIKSLKEKSFLVSYDIDKGKYVILEDDAVENLRFDKRKEPQFLIGEDEKPYGYERSWDSPWVKDFYSVNIATGQKKLLIKKGGEDPIISPDQKHVVYYDRYKKNWYAIELASGKTYDLTSKVNVSFYNEDHDEPSLPWSYGYAGFDKNGNVLLRDKYDLWSISLKTYKITRLTKDGRENEITYNTLKLDEENPSLATYIGKELLLVGYNHKTKTDGVYGLNKGKKVEKLKLGEYHLRGFKKAKNKDVFVWNAQNFTTYPDVQLTTDLFKTTKKITNVNPQQTEFKWGTAELFKWKAYDGKELEGIVYKPENFDETKKYPLITYFYDRNSDNLTIYSSPRPSASIVNPAYLVSNDYIMFVPNIVYNLDGKPGESAYNCIVSGVEALEQKGYIDTNNIGIQGQSWGGYQVAYLITKTNKFKAAMAGAPVSNMTSAYGGIRWQSGLSREFQYEKTQSRIGKNLWEGFDLYIENSPLFKIPNIQTPLLMMHNDNDGAVPYYQGIEMFMGMRRLQKPVWLLVYNNEAHNLRKVKNKQDLSIRMMQFFDHYLKGEPAPKWMTKGVPRVDKGINHGYDLERE
ncbi:S9 family peptidase [Aquimarina rhabdastrellae]